MNQVTATGYDKDRLFTYPQQDQEGFYFIVNRANGERVFTASQRFETSYQATDAGCYFIHGFEIAKKG